MAGFDWIGDMLKPVLQTVVDVKTQEYVYDHDVNRPETTPNQDGSTNSAAYDSGQLALQLSEQRSKLIMLGGAGILAAVLLFKVVSK